MRTTFRAIVVVLLIAIGAPEAAAQIRVNPTGVNVNGQGVTTVFLTFGGLHGYQPAESLWCGALLPASPGAGSPCDPSTIFGSLPARYDRSTLSGVDGFTDIMSIPASVTRRAYQAAAEGQPAAFFYVRHFIDPAGGPDQFVAVTCRLTAGGARVPLSLVDVDVRFDVDTPILQVRPGDRLPRLSARLVYTGTGRLVGRWEVVLPGQETPSADDLLTEGTLPIEERGRQRRYGEVDRFNVFLAPTGRYTLPGPDPARLPTSAVGRYLVLLRIEASEDREGDSDLSAAGAGAGVVHSGGVAGFPMPALEYVVGSGGSEFAPGMTDAAPDALQPADGATASATSVVDLRWPGVAQTKYYRVEITMDGAVVHEALTAGDTTTYRLPPFLLTTAAGHALRWRVVAVDGAGSDGTRSRWRALTVTQ